MRKFVGLAIGRLAVLAFGLALVAGAIWSWKTSPWYLLPDQYFVTVGLGDSALQRQGGSFDIRSAYHRGLLVSGPELKPFGADPSTNVRLLDRGFDLDSPVAKINARLYSQYCGFIDDKVQQTRTAWKQVILCDSGQLQGEILQAAISVFHEKVDDEINNYRFSLMANACDKIGKLLLIAFGLVTLTAAGMWIVKGRLL